MVDAAPLVAAPARAAAPAAAFPAKAIVDCNPPAVRLLNVAAPSARFLKLSPNREVTEQASCITALCRKVAAQVATAPLTATVTGRLAIFCFTTGTSAELVR